MNLFITKPVSSGARVDAGEPALKRVLTAKHLVFLGIGGVIGAGIFVLTGQAAANHAGPAITRELRSCRHCSHPRGALLCGVRCNVAGLGQRLLVRVCNAW